VRHRESTDHHGYVSIVFWFSFVYSQGESVIRGKFGRRCPCVTHLNYCAHKYTP
jgi:hypothetical protein